MERTLMNFGDTKRQISKESRAIEVAMEAFRSILKVRRIYPCSDATTLTTARQISDQALFEIGKILAE